MSSSRARSSSRRNRDRIVTHLEKKSSEVSENFEKRIADVDHASKVCPSTVLVQCSTTSTVLPRAQRVLVQCITTTTVLPLVQCVLVQCSTASTVLPRVQRVLVQCSTATTVLPLVQRVLAQGSAVRVQYGSTGSSPGSVLGAGTPRRCVLVQCIAARVQRMSTGSSPGSVLEVGVLVQCSTDASAVVPAVYWGWVLGWHWQHW